VPAWRLTTEDDDERRTFADLARTLALPWRAAAPPNRLRRVHRIEHGGNTYFLKSFERTQWKNRLWFACTAPRARTDAEREHAVTERLRAAGVLAPRPVAVGRDGGASHYVCAQLPGEPIAQLRRRGQAGDALLLAAARRCGHVIGLGFALPDLSADHVFVQPGGEPRFGILDLHNAGIVAPGRVGDRVFVRLARRTQRSLQATPLPFVLALRLFVALTRAAGLARARRRRLVERLPPPDPARRYERRGKSAAYSARSPRRSRREAALLAAIWPGRRGERVLDLPCGAGRLQPFLAAAGHTVVQVDGALAMLQQAAADGREAAHRAQADARRVPLADRAVDGVVMFRFLHHLTPAEQDLALAEAARVAGRFVVVSFFHPCSAHHLQRRIAGWFGRPSARFPTTLGALRRRLAAHGFVLAAHGAEAPFLRDLWVAVFERRPPGAGA
jgi:SAM-dependent methyltransferase